MYFKTNIDFILTILVSAYLVIQTNSSCDLHSIIKISWNHSSHLGQAILLISALGSNIHHILVLFSRLFIVIVIMCGDFTRFVINLM